MKSKIILVVLIILFIISILFPIHSNIIVKDFDEKETAIELFDDTYTFNLKFKGDNLNLFRFRFCTFATDGHTGVIHYKLIDSDNNIIFDKTKSISELEDSKYIDELFDKQKDSSEKTYSLVINYEKYNKDERFGIWGNKKGSESNYLTNDNSFGLEVYTKEDVPNTIISWFLLIGILTDVAYLILEKDFNHGKKKK